MELNLAKPVQLIQPKFRTQVKAIKCKCTDCLTKKVNEFLETLDGGINAIQYSSSPIKDGEVSYSALIIWTKNV